MSRTHRYRTILSAVFVSIESDDKKELFQFFLLFYILFFCDRESRLCGLDRFATATDWLPDSLDSDHLIAKKKEKLN